MVPAIRNVTSSLSSPAQWLIDWVRGGPQADSGVSVDVHSSMGLAPVWYAVSTIAGHIGMLPLNVHRRVEGGSEHAVTHPLYRILKTRPNEYQTSIVFREQMMVHSLLLGNGRAAIVRQGSMVSELIPMLPNNTYTCMVDGKKWHVVQADRDDRIEHAPGSPKRFRDGVWYKIPDEDVLHIPGLGFDGIAGKSLIQVAKDTIGLGIAAQKASSRAFANGGKPGVVIEAPQGMFRDPKDAEEFLNNWNNWHEGLDNFGRAALLREGMKVTTMAVSAQEAEWVAQRQFQRKEIALLFGIQSLPGDEDSVSYSSLEQKNIAYLQNCLMKWIAKWEQECDHKLITARAQNTFFTKFNVDALLRADSKTRMETLSLGITSRIYSPNEARELLDMLPYEGGDEFANPAITPGQGGDDQEPSEEPVADPPAPEDASRRAIHSRLEHLIGVEAKHVVRAAKFAPDKNYLDWIDHFYTKKWHDTMCEAVKAICGSEKIAIEYCRTHHNELLEMTGMVTPDGLADAVAETVSSWPGEARTLTDQLLCKELTNV